MDVMDHSQRGEVSVPPEEYKVGITPALHHRFQIKRNRRLTGYTRILVQQTQAQSIRHHPPQMFRRTVQQSLHQAGRAVLIATERIPAHLIHIGSKADHNPAF